MNFEKLLGVLRPGEFADLIERRKSYISQVRSMPVAPSRLTSHIERRLHLPDGWMQELHTDAEWVEQIGDLTTIPMTDGNGSVTLTNHRRELLELTPWGKMVAHVVQDAALTPSLIPGDLVLIDTQGGLRSDAPMLVRADGHFQLRYAVQTESGFRLVAAMLQRPFFPDMDFNAERVTLIGPVIWRCGAA